MDLEDKSVTSDKDYLEIAFEGSTTVSTVGGGDPDAAYPANPGPGFDSGSVTITHNLGSIPIVRLFYDPLKNGVWYNTLGFENPVSAGATWNEPAMFPVITTSTVKFVLGSDSGAQTDIPIFYRIYDLGDKTLTSDERVDKIFLKDSTVGTVDASAGAGDPGTLRLIIPHGKSDWPLWTLQFSENTVTWYQEGTRIAGNALGGGAYNYTHAYGSADSTNFYVTLVNGYNTEKTIYVRYVLEYRE